MTKLLFTALFLVTGLFAWAETPLTVHQAVEEALNNNLGLKAADVATQIKKRDHDLAWNKFYPSVSVSGGYMRLNDVTASERPIGIIPTSPPQLLWLVPSNDNILTSFKAQFALSPAMFAAVDQTLIDYNNAKISLSEARQNLSTEVKKLFYQLLVLQETIKVTEADLANAKERYRQAQVNYNAGLAPELTMLQSQVAYENRKPALDNLQVNYQQVLFAFENLLGRDSDPKLKLSGTLDVPSNLPTLNAQTLADKFIDRRWDLQAAEGHVKAADGYRNIANGSLWPSLILSYSADPTLNGYFYSKWDQGSSWLQQTGSFTVLLNWQLDALIPTSQADNQRQDASDAVKAAKLQLAELEQTARSQVVTDVARLNTAVVALSSQEANVAVAQKAYQLTDEAYKTGAKSFLEVQDAELQYETAQLNLLNEKDSYITALLDLETALNSTREEIYGK